MYLLDTNVLIEVLLGQERTDEVKRFLETATSAQLHLTDFSLYSIGILMVREKRGAAFQSFLDDTVLGGKMNLIALSPRDLKQVIRTAERYRLDFDDAYQLAAAEKHGLTVISFDSHFDRTDRGRKTPAQATKE
jgi:predicted nucleic acid-binding protein